MKSRALGLLAFAVCLASCGTQELSKYAYGGFAGQCSFCEPTEVAYLFSAAKRMQRGKFNVFLCPSRQGRISSLWEKGLLTSGRDAGDYRFAVTTYVYLEASATSVVFTSPRRELPRYMEDDDYLVSYVPEGYGDIPCNESYHYVYQETIPFSSIDGNGRYLVESRIEASYLGGDYRGLEAFASGIVTINAKYVVEKNGYDLNVLSLFEYEHGEISFSDFPKR